MPFIKTYCFFILAIALIASCRNEPEQPFLASGVKSNLAPAQSETMGKLVNDYLSLKNALVATDNQQANKSAMAMQQQLKSFQVSSDSTMAKPFNQANMISALASMDKDLNGIISHNDKSCEPQRIYFKRLSDSLYAFVKNYQTVNLHLYHNFCPMAMNGKGAWWLSASKKIENPYFGSKMLTCGEMVDTLQ